MANPQRQSKPDIEKSEQELINKSFDREFDVLAVEPLGYDSTNNVMRRQEVDESGQLMVSAGTIESLVDELASLVNSLKFLSATQGVASDLRVTLLSGVLTTVTTVTTLTGQTNIGGYGAQHTIMNQMNTNVATAIRNNITVS